MKKLITLLSALFLIAGLASAQTADSTSHHRMGGKMAMHHFGRNHISQKLNLTDDQKTQMKSVNDDYRKQLTALKGNDKMTVGDYKTQMEALRKSHHEQVSNILTDEQKKTIADNRSNMRGRMHGRGAGGFDKMKQNLGLSDDQAAKLKSQRDELRTQLQSIHNDNTLQPDQKKAKAKELFAQHKEQLKSVLTPDQLTKLQSMHRGHMGHGKPADGTDGQAK